MLADDYSAARRERRSEPESTHHQQARGGARVCARIKEKMKEVEGGRTRRNTKELPSPAGDFIKIHEPCATCASPWWSLSFAR